MRALLQRVTQSCVRVDGQSVGAIGPGWLILLGVGADDVESDALKLAQKIVHLRLFNDEQGKFNRSLLNIAGHALVVSQFTLYADTRKGRRPNFTQAAPPDLAQKLIDRFVESLRQLGVPNVQTGQFGAAMTVEIHNDGPVTIWLDSADLS